MAGNSNSLSNQRRKAVTSSRDQSRGSAAEEKGLVSKDTLYTNDISCSLPCAGEI